MTRAVAILCLLISTSFAISLALDPASRETLQRLLGVHAAGLFLRQYWSFLTYQLLHGSWLHLTLNLLTLVSVGPGVERVVGPFRLLALFLVSGVLGAAVWLMLVWPVDVPLIGASAAICGLLGALAALRPREKYALIFLPIPLPAWLVISALAATQIIYLVIHGAGGHVAYSAHLAGGVTGFLLALWIRRTAGTAKSS